MRIFILLMLFSVVLTSCYKDEIINSSEDIVVEEPEIIIEETDVFVHALDNDGLPSTTTTLVVNEQEFNSDLDFHYNTLANARKSGQFLFLKENDEIIGLANAYLLENDINYLEIKALPKAEMSVLSQTNILSNDITLVNNNASIVDENGNVVTENISINHKHSKDEFILNRLGTSGINTDGSLLTLNPNQFFSFTLVNTDNQLLNFADNSGFTFDATLSANENLFRLDVLKDEWMLVNLSSSELLKPGFYLIAESTAGVYVEGDILKKDDPVSFLSFEWVEGDYSFSANATSLGRWGSVVPVNADVAYNWNSPCGDVLQSDLIVSSTVKKTDFSVSLDENVGNLVKVDTKVFDCNGNIDLVPAITIQNEGEDFVYIFNDAEVDTWLAVCTDNFQIGGYNVLDGQNGPLVNWSIGSNNEINYLSNCEDFEDGYTYIQIGTDSHLYQPFEFNYNGELTTLKEKNDKVFFRFNGDIAMIYDNEDIRVFIDDPDFALDNGYYVSCLNSGCGMDRFNVTHYDETINDGWLRISFSGNIWMLRTGPENKAGNFAIEGVILSKL